MKQPAFSTAISYLFAQKRLIFVESMTSKEGKTKELAARLRKIGRDKALLSDSVMEEMFLRASKNLKNFKFISAQGVNVYDLLKFDCAIWTPAVLPEIYKKCGAHDIGANQPLS